MHLDNSPGNTIGGTATGAGNLISGNDGSGLVLNNANINLILNNSIGTDLSGTAAVGNLGTAGIQLTNSTRDVLVSGNLISGNTVGVVIDSASVFNRLEGNRIGTDTAGSAAIANTGDGVAH